MTAVPLPVLGPETSKPPKPRKNYSLEPRDYPLFGRPCAKKPCAEAKAARSSISPKHIAAQEDDEKQEEINWAFACSAGAVTFSVLCTGMVGFSGFPSSCSRLRVLHSLCMCGGSWLVLPDAAQTRHVKAIGNQTCDSCRESVNLR